MIASEWLVTTLIASALLLPSAVWFGIRIGMLREADRRRQQLAMYDAQMSAYMHHPARTRHLLNWQNGNGSQEDL